MQTIFKDFIEFVTTLLLFFNFFFFFGLELCGVLAPQLRIELAAPAIGRQSLSHIFLIDLVSGHFPMSTVSVSLQVGGLIGGG